MKKSNLTRFNPWFSTILLLLGLAIPISGFTQATQSITFCVDYSCVAQTPDFAAQQIFFQGGPFDGFRPLTNSGNNVWCGTFALPAGEVRYNFFYAGAAGAGGPENLGSLDGQSCVSTGAGGLKRTYTVVAGSPVTLTFAWESCSSTPNCAPPPPTAPTVAAPTPTCPANQVISLFSDAYTNVPVNTWLTPWSSAAGGAIVPVAGNNTRLYTNVDFLGIETTGANLINATGMTNFHIDIWTPNMTTFRVKLVDFGANGSFGGGDDREGEIAFTPVQGGWNSYVIPLASFQAVGLANRANIAQFILSGIPVGQGTVYVDNMYFSSCQVAPPTVDVTFCVDYSCVAQTPGFAAQQINFQGVTINGFRNLNNTGNNIWCGTFAFPVGEAVRYSFYYAGASGVVGDESLTGSGTCFSQGAGGLKRTYTVVAGSPVTLTFAWGSCSSTPNCPPPPPTAPTVAAPAPICLQENVISLFSDAYTNVPVNTWLTPWSGATGGTIVPIAGNNTRLYNNVNFLGIETTGANLINATEMANFHIDIWTPNMTTFRVKLVDFGANGNFGGGDDREGEIAFTPVQGGWNSYVIPLASFQAVGLANRANIAQLILSGIPVGQGTLYVDNIFFSRTNCEVSCLPVVTCNDQTVTLNGQNSIALVAGQLATASGNCGTPTLTLSPNGGVITCLQLGQVVPVTVTAAYAGNNTASCTSNITVAGLPCGWSQNPNGVNCANGSSIAYNSGTGVWTATSTNCFYGPGFTSDQMAFAQRTLCGSGSITAQVTSINGSGWAGVVMRESNAAGAKKAQLMTNLSNFSRREFRTATNAAAQPQQFPSQNRYWLRLVRAGNQFSMFVSPNGMAWYLVGTQNIVMGNCIQMGLVATNYTSNSTVTATFANVSYSGSNTSLLVQAPSLMLQAASEGEPVQLDFGVYPNPTTGELNIDLAAYAGRAVRIELYSADGKLLKFSEVNEIQAHIERIDLSAFKPGMYMLKVKCEGLPDASRRVVLIR